MRATQPVWGTAQSPPRPNRVPAAGPPPTPSAVVCTSNPSELTNRWAHKLDEKARFFSRCHVDVDLNLLFVKPDVNAPFKKRHHKYLTETTPAPSDHLLRPLSPITPPLPEDSLHPLLPQGLLLPNGLAYSPMPSLPPSRCNTPLQFEVRTLRDTDGHIQNGTLGFHFYREKYNLYI